MLQIIRQDGRNDGPHVIISMNSFRAFHRLLTPSLFHERFEKLLYTGGSKNESIISSLGFFCKELMGWGLGVSKLVCLDGLRGGFAKLRTRWDEIPLYMYNSTFICFIYTAARRFDWIA